mgnify:CR=1 FL=1
MTLASSIAATSLNKELSPNISLYVLTSLFNWSIRVFLNSLSCIKALWNFTISAALVFSNSFNLFCSLVKAFFASGNAAKFIRNFFISLWLDLNRLMYSLSCWCNKSKFKKESRKSIMTLGFSSLCCKVLAVSPCP